MRIALILLFLIKVKICEQNSNNDTNKELIYNGKIYNRNEYPFVVFFEFDFIDYLMCTGSLIRELYVLTAAHCTTSEVKEGYKVYNGPKLNNDVWRKVVEIHTHPDYEPDNKNRIQGDLSVLKLNASFPTAGYIEIGGHVSDFEDLKAIKCEFIGFGIIDKHRTQGLPGYIYTSMVRHGQKACMSWDSEQISASWQQYLCAVPGKSMVCQGDSGGPMICNGKLYGVCSIFFNWAGDPNECGGKNMQTIHVFVQHFKPWLDTIVKLDKFTTKKNGAEKSILTHHTFCVVFAVLWYNVVLSFY